MKLLFPIQNYNVLSPSSYTHIFVRNVYISRIGLPSAAGKYMDQFWEYKNCSQQMNVEIGTEAAQFPEKEDINGIFFAVWNQGAP
jgi:hypothetical protein